MLAGRRVRLVGQSSKLCPMCGELYSVEGHQTIYFGSPERITYNCFFALVHLRHATKQRTLWIDAICIDQSKDEQDTNERNQQIQRMGGLYHKASHAISWLDFKEFGNTGLFMVVPQSSLQQKLQRRRLGALAFKMVRVLTSCYKGLSFQSDKVHLRRINQAKDRATGE